MAAHINLYDPALRRQRELFSLATLCAAAAILMLLLGAAGAALHWRAAAARAALAAADAELTRERGEIAALGTPGGQLATLRRQTTELRAALARKREVIDALRSGGLLRDEAFSAYLGGLARRDVDGLWLTAFSVGPGPAAMEIRGRVADARALPRYLDQLGTDTVFAGRSFASLLVERGALREGRPFYADFVLRAEPPAAGSAR